LDALQFQKSLAKLENEKHMDEPVCGNTVLFVHSGHTGKYTWKEGYNWYSNRARYRICLCVYVCQFSHSGCLAKRI
jgi:hypothetical protein